jgi:xylulose-5-phosphate/fructose-6-phosphate phosphoketolase
MATTAEHRTGTTDDEEATATGEVSLADVDAWWRAANYLSVGQIYLLANPLLREPLTRDHIKPRLLGHWGTCPGLNLLWAHLNRFVRHTERPVLFVTGPGHGGPAALANAWLEGTYGEIYPEVTRDGEGMVRLFRQFSTPGGVPSHVSVPTPGSIHEGGELGYALAHATGAAFDDPDLVVATVIGDGEAETGPLAASWLAGSFLNPARDGTVLPILHLNGAKISGPAVLARLPAEDLRAHLAGLGWDPVEVAGDDPEEVHGALAAALDGVHDRLLEIHGGSRAPGTTPADATKVRWPMLVLRTPKGWTGPHEVDGKLVEGTFRSHQVPLSNVREDDAERALLEEWMRSYRPDGLFDDQGRPTAATIASVPRRDLRIAATDRANGGRRLVELELPDWEELAIEVPEPGRSRAESTRLAGQLFRDAYRRNTDNFRLFCPDETNSNRLGAVFEATDRCLLERIEPSDEHQAPDGRVMEVLSEHLCQGWLEGYTLTGRHGVFASYEAFAMVSASMTVQHAKWLQEAAHLPWRADVPSLNILLTSTCWRNDHNGFSHQGPGLIDTVLSKEAGVARIYLPPDGNSLLSVTDHCLRSRNYVNLVVIDKQSQLQWMTADEARVHCSRGLGRWDWASTDGNGTGAPDVVLACIGDVPTLETVAAADILRRHVPELAVRVVNVVDLMSLFTPDEHPHGIDGLSFADLFTEDTHVVVAFHGYARAIHQLIHGRPEPTRFHVKGFREQGTTTTPFDMVVRNGMSRYHLVLEAMDRSARSLPGFDALAAHCEEQLDRHDRWVTKHLQDLPEIREWSWPHGR